MLSLCYRQWRPNRVVLFWFGLNRKAEYSLARGDIFHRKWQFCVIKRRNFIDTWGPIDGGEIKEVNKETFEERTMLERSVEEKLRSFILTYSIISFNYEKNLLRIKVARLRDKVKDNKKYVQQSQLGDSKMASLKI